MSDGNLANLLRPTRFEEVVGQDRSVKFLSGLIRRGQRKRDLLLHGAVGSGKTTLARIYAKALNCDHPDPHTGSPCHACEWCHEQREHEYALEYDVAGGKGDIKNILAQLERLRSISLPPSKTKVAFYDEAHRLSPQASDALLKAIEDRSDGEVFIVATSQHENLNPALVSRLIPVEVHQLPFAMAREFLSTTASSKGVSIDGDALDLLVGLTPGSPRNLLNSLERFANDDGGSIRLADVKFVLNVEHIDILPQYLKAVGDGQFARQLEILGEWREPSDRKVLWIRAMLAAIYYNDVLAVSSAMHPAIDAVGEGARRAILASFQKRFGVIHPENLAPMWREMLQHWHAARENLTGPELAVQCGRFDQLVSDLARRRPNSEVRATPHARHAYAGGGGFRRRPDLPPRIVASQPAVHAVPQDHHYVSDQEVRAIMNAASFLVQEHGVLFDLRFVLETARPGEIVPEGALVRADESWTRLAGRELNPDLHFIRVCERYGGRIKISLAVATGLAGDPLQPETQALERTVEKICGEWSQAFPSTMQVRIRATLASGTPADRLRFHWGAVRGLCQSVASEFHDYDPKEGAWLPLRKLLRLPKAVGQTPQPLLIPVLARSSSLSESAILRASALKLEPISAYDNRVWSELYSGWEREEHGDRITTRLLRERQMRQLEVTHRGNIGGLEEQRRELEATWPDDPLARKRGRLGWWTDARRSSV